MLEVAILFCDRSYFVTSSSCLLCLLSWTMSKSTRRNDKLSNLTSEVENSGHTARPGVLRHDERCKRFTLLVDGGHEAILDYETVETDSELTTFDLYHTEVPEALRGKGIGKVLAKAVFDELLSAHPDARLILTCTFLQHFYASNKGLFAGKKDAFSTPTPTQQPLQ